MAEKKIIAVVGATGAQGGGLVRAILDDPQGGFAARAITRDPSSAAAQKLAAAGAEVVAGDVDDAASIRKAFEGAYGAFCVTFFWNHFSPELEMKHARVLADAARDARVQHVIWSTLEDTRKWVPLSDDRMPTLQQHYKVPHFDGKGEADAYFSDLPVTYLLTSFYWENFIHFGMGPRRDAGGKLGIAFPMGDEKLPSIAVEDIGRAAYGIFKRGKEMIGKRVGVAGAHLSGQEFAATFSKVFGEPVSYQALDPAQYRKAGFPGAEDLGNMFQFNRDFAADFCNARPVDGTRALNPRLQEFEQWLTKNKDRISLGG